MKSELLSMKEIAAELKRDRKYVWAMKSRGFKMPGGRATLAEARAWLEIHPEPRSRPTTPRRAPSGGVQLRPAHA